MKCKSKREAYADLRKKKLAMDNARKAMYNSGGVHPRINIAFNKACWEWEDAQAYIDRYSWVWAMRKVDPPPEDERRSAVVCGKLGKLRG